MDIRRVETRYLFFTGKGGVGKTTVAAAIALELARRGHRVSLSTTDPAAHLSWLIDDLPKGLKVGRIDAEVETAAYRHEVMDTVGAGLDENGRALLIEDLRSPCTEEVAVFRAFARTVDEGAEGGSSSSTRRRWGTRSCCSTRPRRTTAKCFDMRAICPTPSRRSCRACATSRSRGCFREVEEAQTRRVALIPWLLGPPVGCSGLRSVLGERSFGRSEEVRP